MASKRGNLDLVSRDRIEGWAQDADQPDASIRLRILDNKNLLVELSADQYRADLEEAGIGNGRHAFSFTVPGGLAPDLRHLIEVQFADDGHALSSSPHILEATAGQVIVSSRPAAWRGALDLVTRERIEGWAWDDQAPQSPMALVILSNGEVIARVLANRYRQDLQKAGMGGGRHAFSVMIPGGLSPLTRHVIQILGESDGCEMGGSPVAIESTQGFDPALEHAVATAVAALATPGDRDRTLDFLAEQIEHVLQGGADAASGREARLIRKALERRWGKGGIPFNAGLPSCPRALVVDDFVPSPGQDAGSTAILSHMHALRELGYEVTFVAAEDMSPAPGALDHLAAREIQCLRTPYYVSVEEVLRRQPASFEVIYLHRVSNAAKYLALARRYCPKARILYSVADLHHVRLERQATVEARPELLALSRRLRLQEFAAACTANAVITHSPVEAALLRKAVANCSVYVVPWEVPVKPTARPWNERSGIAFIANFAFPPNIDAARILASTIVPRLRQENPAMECLLIGSHMPESVNRLAAPGVVPLGYVSDLSTIYERVRLTTAPLRFGAGVKGKVLESMAAGVPCVMSSVAAEGISLSDVLMTAVGSDLPDITSKILRLYSDEQEYRALSKAGLAFISAGYAHDVVVTGLKAAVEGRRQTDLPEADVGQLSPAAP